ncbi:MAG: type VI secretion system baseplate subunit TssF [Tropicimonas sp.]|uniref:type VI secretion system baseplate subunit TssF n=1 Tax=Tropicimonas sp. TaxID=2067044 RepID=UPI003A8C4479
MANRFLEYYNDELDALRRRATRFADSYPKIAGRLRLAREASDDPHVERLVQSFAYSAARVRQKIDDSLPELTDGLLETLYPHYLAPLPAMSLVAFEAARELEAAQRVPAGTEVLSEPVEGDICRFRTSQDVEIAPIRIKALRMMDRPVEAPPRQGLNAAACLCITLEPTGKAPLSELGLNRLRFYLSGPARHANALFRMLHHQVTGIDLATHSADTEARRLAPGAIRPTGFADDTALLPYPEGSFRGYRMLTEFFTLPEKFLFFDIETGPLRENRRLDIYIYFDTPPGGLERQVDAAHLTLHATPIVNLFRSRTEPITLDGTASVYRLQADARRPLTRQVYAVSHVTLARSDGRIEESRPFFHRLTDRGGDGIYWQIRRHGEEGGRLPGATSIAFVDTREEPVAPADTTASIEVLATNGALPRRLPFGGGQPRLKLASGVDHVAGVSCLRPMTTTRQAHAARDRAWQLMSHLSLNHLSLTADGTPVLRNILRLYDPGDSRETAQLIDAIEAVSARPGLTRMQGVLVSGTDVTITFDDQRIDPGQAVVFGSVLDRFLGCYTALNTFTRLTLQMKDRTDALARFAARAGEEALI